MPIVLLWELRDTSTMKMKSIRVLHVLVSIVRFLVCSQNSMAHRRSMLSISKKSNPNDAIVTARWLVSQNFWAVLNTISIDLGGAPWGIHITFSSRIRVH
ncbi:hypothetical protein Ahy_A07g036439 isoform A [Arachis hypogaea]|uniref:Uncharacterized protein n=1 Tax=Arachis hypogaea TaxID=3818 RepID=A0A445CG75_ARAHY|nr:hypothetical protein Ahy_A07g036439 isoform A [Arachis hypogaea]